MSEKENKFIKCKHSKTLINRNFKDQFNNTLRIKVHFRGWDSQYDELVCIIENETLCDCDKFNCQNREHRIAKLGMQSTERFGPDN